MDKHTAAALEYKMARYPTFDEYAKRGNYQDGINRCDELIKRNPNDFQLLTVKLQLLYAAGQDGNPVLAQLATVQPPLLDPWDIVSIEQVVVESLDQTYPIPLTAGPAVAKLWENALKLTTSINHKLDLLNVRFARAIIDNRLSDAQQALIQVKAIQPKDRSFYMAHAAITQLLSSSKDDLQSRLALSLARKAVSERFDDDQELDCRVPGQIFAMQGSTKDLESIAGRSFQESQQVYNVLRICKPSSTDGEDISAVPDPSNTIPREWLVSEITSLKRQLRNLFDHAASLDLLAQFVTNAIRLFRAGIADLGLSQARAPSDICFLAISGLIKMFDETRQMPYLLHAAFLAEFLLKQNPYVHEARLILVYLYSRLGLGSLAIGMFDSLSVKEIQHDTVGHTLLTHVSQSHPFGIKIPNRDTFDPHERTARALAVYNKHDNKLAETEATVLRHGQSGMLFDLQNLRDDLRTSLVRRLFLLEHRRIARLVGKPVAKAVTDIGPKLTANWTVIADNRDFNATFNHGFNVEKALYGCNDVALETKSIILSRLLIDTIWSLADQRPLLVNDIDILLQETEKASEVARKSIFKASHSIRAEFLAGNIALHLARVLSKVAAKAPVPPEEFELVISDIEALHIDDLITTSDIATEHLSDHYIYLDLLRVVVLATRYIQETIKQPPSRLPDLQNLVKSSIGQIVNHSQAHSTTVKPANVRNALSQMGSLDHELNSFGDEAIHKFCEKVAASAKEGWNGIANVSLR